MIVRCFTRLFFVAVGFGILNLAICAPTWAGVFYTPDAAYPGSSEVFTVDPQPITNANRGLTTTRELYQTFQNPTTFDVNKIVMSFRVTNASTGLQLKLYEVDDVNTTPLVLGSLIHTIPLAVGTYTTSANRIGVTLTDSDIFSLPQRDSGTTGYALSISQIDTSTSTVSGNLFYANNGTNNYPNGKVFQESLVHSSDSRDAGIALSSVPEPASAALVLLGLSGVAATMRRRHAA